MPSQVAMEKEKEQSEYANNNACCKVCFVIWRCQLLFDVFSKQPQVTN